MDTWKDVENIPVGADVRVETAAGFTNGVVTARDEKAQTLTINGVKVEFGVAVGRADEAEKKEE